MKKLLLSLAMATCLVSGANAQDQDCSDSHTRYNCNDANMVKFTEALTVCRLDTVPNCLNSGCKEYGTPADKGGPAIPAALNTPALRAQIKAKCKAGTKLLQVVNDLDKQDAAAKAAEDKAAADKLKPAPMITRIPSKSSLND